MPRVVLSLQKIPAQTEFDALSESKPRRLFSKPLYGGDPASTKPC